MIRETLPFLFERGYSFQVGSHKDHPALWIKNLLYLRGRRLDFHAIVRADEEGCFHTHPATAIRVILRGGYMEEMLDEGAHNRLIARHPGHVGIVRPEMCHRIHRLLNGPSYSLWLRGQIVADTLLKGTGWHEKERVETAAGDEVITRA